MRIDFKSLFRHGYMHRYFVKYISFLLPGLIIWRISSSFNLWRPSEPYRSPMPWKCIALRFITCGPNRILPVIWQDMDMGRQRSMKETTFGPAPKKLSMRGNALKASPDLLTATL